MGNLSNCNPSPRVRMGTSMQVAGPVGGIEHILKIDGEKSDGTDGRVDDLLALVHGGGRSRRVVLLPT